MLDNEYNSILSSEDMNLLNVLGDKEISWLLSLLPICIKKYEETCDAWLKDPKKDYFGSPPKRMIIYFGKSYSAGHFVISPMITFLYQDGILKIADNDIKPSLNENGMFHEDASAQLSFGISGSRQKGRKSRKAISNSKLYIIMHYGIRYAQCYKYDIDSDDKAVNEKLAWIS